jgi:hypothetical protein
MDYNWEKVFSEKDSHELYHIVTGKKPVPPGATSFARKELLKRNIDPDTACELFKQWEIIDLQEDEEEFLRRLEKFRRNVFIRFPYYLVAIVSVVFITIIITNNYGFPVSDTIFISVLTVMYISFVVLMNNTIYKKEKIRFKNCRLKIIENRKRIEQLREELEKEYTPAEYKTILQQFEDVVKQRNVEFIVVAVIIMIAVVIISLSV